MTKSGRADRKAVKPLRGVRVLVGRARHQAGSLSTQLRKLGADVLEIPFIEIRKPRSFKPLDTALKSLAAYDWLLLTSVNGVEALWDRLRKLRLTNRSLEHLKIAAIGPATKKAIEARGMKVHVVPEEYIAESVVKRLRARVKGKRILLVRARVARDVIPRELRKAGAQLDVCEAYETVVPEIIADSPARRAQESEPQAWGYYLHQFVDGQEFCGAVSAGTEEVEPASRPPHGDYPGLNRSRNFGHAPRTSPWR